MLGPNLFSAAEAEALDITAINHEPEVCDAIRRFVKPGDTVIDAGANIGFFTLLLSDLVGDDGLVIAIEPDEAARGILTKNIYGRGRDNVLIGTDVLWSKDGVMQFWPTEAIGYSSLLRYENSLDAKHVYARALDSLYPTVTPRLIKIDCEGADGHILCGAEKMLSRGVECVLAEFNFDIMGRFGLPEDILREHMRALGYECFVLEPHFVPRQVPPAAKIKMLETAGQPHVNVMFAAADVITRLWSI